MIICEKETCKHYTTKEENHCAAKYRVEDGFCETYVGKEKEVDGDVQSTKSNRDA